MGLKEHDPPAISPGPEAVENALSEKGVAYRRIEAAAASAHQAARSLSAEPGAVVKSLVFLADGQPTLILVGGDRRADPARLRQVLGARRVMIAPPDRVREATGYAPGAVPAIGHIQPLSTWIDAALGEHPTVYTSGGAADVMVAMTFDDLLRVTGGQVVEVSTIKT